MKWQIPAEENFWQNRKIMTEILISSWNFYFNWITEVPLRNYQISYGSEVMTFCLDFIVMFSTYQLYVTSILWNVINIIYNTINITVDFVQDGEQLILHFSNNQKSFSEFMVQSVWIVLYNTSSLFNWWYVDFWLYALILQ